MLALRLKHRVSPLIWLAIAAVVLDGCAPAHRAASGTIAVVAAENFYADVATKIGAPYVSVTSILNNPNTDPHAYESNTNDANAVASAALLVQNGMGYDAFMDSLAAASPNARRRVISAEILMNAKKGANPHLWYDPRTMPKVAAAIAQALCAIQPAHCSIFNANQRRFLTTLSPWQRAIASLAKRAPRAPIAITEPVFSYTARAIGLTNRTPRAFALAVEEGNDPAPQDVAYVENLLATHAVRALMYNEQTIAPTTTRILNLAKAAHVPIVAVYETMPRGFSYARWMTAEVAAVAQAVLHGRSTEQLP